MSTDEIDVLPRLETFILQFDSEILNSHQNSAVRNDVPGRGLSRPGIERGRLTDGPRTEIFEICLEVRG